eukprot:13490889-Heterocapsa_arctica.AAC.1
METMVVETQQKLRRLETTMAAQTAQSAEGETQAVRDTEDPTAGRVMDEPPWRTAKGIGKKGKNKGKNKG